MRIRYRGSRQRSSRRLIRASERQDSGRQRQRVPHEAQKRQEKKQAPQVAQNSAERASERAGEAEAEAKGQRQCDHKKQVSKAKALQSHKLAQQRRQPEHSLALV